MPRQLLIDNTVACNLPHESPTPRFCLLVDAYPRSIVVETHFTLAVPAVITDGIALPRVVTCRD